MPILNLIPSPLFLLQNRFKGLEKSAGRLSTRHRIGKSLSTLSTNDKEGNAADIIFAPSSADIALDLITKSIEFQTVSYFLSRKAQLTRSNLDQGIDRRDVLPLLINSLKQCLVGCIGVDAFVLSKPNELMSFECIGPRLPALECRTVLPTLRLHVPRPSRTAPSSNVVCLKFFAIGRCARINHVWHPMNVDRSAAVRRGEAVDGFCQPGLRNMTPWSGQIAVHLHQHF